LKRPPDRKLLLTVAILIVAASSLLARPAAKGETDTMNHVVLGGR
jgi:hypothetical protein